MTGWQQILPALLERLDPEGAAVDRRRVTWGTTAYLVPAFDRSALQFSLPILVPRRLFDELPLDPRGVDGAVACLIEQCKTKARERADPALDPLTGRGTRFPHRYQAITEPYSLISSPALIGEGLWKAGGQNYADADGVHLTLTGALRYGLSEEPGEQRRVVEELAALVRAVAGAVDRVSLRLLEREWINALDQRLLRDRLPALGLVSFIGDGTRPARQCTDARCFFRVAGIKAGVHVPFACPPELEPIEVELPASHQVIAGLGVREREVLAIIGSNGQGKSTMLQAVIAGVDDHQIGDGREHVITRSEPAIAEAGSTELRGTDLSLFFRALPPGMSGSPEAAFGQGSGSMGMASQIQQAIAGEEDLLVFDEDRSAANLLVPGCLSGPEVRVLSTLLAEERERLGATSLVFTAGTLDILVAQADRILVLDGHQATAIGRAAYRRRLKDYLSKVLEAL
ncbi:P-loop domain-containing protein [Methanosphaerula subterraneus]|uniref:P-loop domain-containing protein n=1 Tax=Methanosphaerula subterraneus TaxID=3350244 RepID=UPI003F86FA9D